MRQPLLAALSTYAKHIPSALSDWSKSLNHRRSPNAPRPSLLLPPRIVLPKAPSKLPIFHVPQCSNANSLTPIKTLFTRCHQMQLPVIQLWFFLSFPLIQSFKFVKSRVLWAIHTQTLVFKACARSSVLMVFGAMGA